MKKFITLVAAAAMTLSTSAEVIYSWQSEGTDAVQQVGGTATAKVDEARVNYSNTCNGTTYYTICLCGKKSTYPESAYVNVSLDQPLAEGDVISVTAYRNKNEAGKNVTVEFLFDGKADNSIASTEPFANINPDGEADPAPTTQTFTVPASAAGATFFDMTRGSAGTNLFITKLEITREAAATGAFEWTPMFLYPTASQDILVSDFMGSVSFNSYIGEEPAKELKASDVMPVWIDEEGNEIKALSVEQDPWGMDASSFSYSFDVNEIKANGEYILLFPEGMLVNAAGEKSAKVQIPYTLNDPALAPAMFEDFEVLSVIPELSQDQGIWNDLKITVNTNHNDAIGVTTLQITDLTDGEVVVSSSNFASGRQLGDSSPISWEVAGTYKFYQEHIYRAEFLFYNGENEFDAETGMPTPIVAKAMFDFAGKVEGFKYSSVELLSVAPAPYSTIISEPSQAVFTYTFSGPVTVYKAVTPLGMNGEVDYPASCLSSNEDKTVWTLNLSDQEYINSVDAMLTVNIYARDEEGFQLKGNFGEENNSCFECEWQCDLGAFPIVVASPAAGETVDRLSEVVIKAADGKPMSWSWMGEIAVVNQLGEILGTLVYDQPEGEDADAAVEEIRFTRWMDDTWNVTDIDLVKEGYYAIQVAPGCFLQGDQFESKQSKSLVSTVIVSGVLDNEPDEPAVDPAEQEKFMMVSANPADGSTVTSLSTIQVIFQDVVNCEEFYVNVYNVADQSLVTTGYALYDWDVMEALNIDLTEPVTVAGQYEVVIPARMVGDDEFYSSEGTKGICNPEIKLTYTVEPDGTGVVSVAAEAVGNVYDVNGRLVLRNASAADVNSLQKGIYIVNGKKVVK